MSHKVYQAELILIAILRSDWDQVSYYLKNKNFNTNKFKSLIRKTGLGSYIYWLINNDFKKDIFSEELIAFFKKCKEKLKIDNSYILGTLDKVIRSFEEEGIEVILLKGADLLHRVYKSLDLRHLDDIDILIHFSDIDRAINSLRKIDFKIPSQGELNYFKKAAYNIDCRSYGNFPCLFEIHWDLSQKFRYRINMVEIWNSCQTVRDTSLSYPKFLKPEFLFVHLCLHLFHHSFHAQLKWHIDLKEILENLHIDIDEVLEISKRWGCQYSLYYALLYLKKIFPNSLNNEIFNKLNPPKFRDYIISRYFSKYPLTLFDSRGRRFRERLVRTMAIDRKIDIFLFSLHRLIRNPWVRFEKD